MNFYKMIRFYNPFHEIFETRKYPHARTLRTSLSQKIKDAHFVFAGSAFDKKKRNHLGLIDYFTLGIFYILGLKQYNYSEKINKDIQTKNKHKIMSKLILFSTLIIGFPVIGLNHLLAATLTFLVSPIIATVHVFSLIKGKTLQKEVLSLSITQTNTNNEIIKTFTLKELLQEKEMNLENLRLTAEESKNNQVTLTFSKATNGAFARCRMSAGDDKYKHCIDPPKEFDLNGKAINYSEPLYQAHFNLNPEASENQQTSASLNSLKSLLQLNIGNINAKLNGKNFDFNFFKNSKNNKKTQKQENNGLSHYQPLATKA